jgi:hypothetical protein
MMIRRWIYCISVAVATVIAGPTAGAQRMADWEIRPFAGYAIPTGAHRDDFNNAVMSGAEGAVRLTADLDLIGSFAWQPSRGKYNVSERYADVWVFNFGLERSFRGQRLSGSGFVPFFGGGVGGRSYDFRSSALNSSTCYSGYVNGGSSYERGRSTVRLELRDNVFCYKSPVGALDEQTRNEIGILMAIGFRF